MDILNFSGELNRLRQGGDRGAAMISTSREGGQDLDGMGSNANSINKTWAGGVNYNNIIGNKTDFTSNYFYNRSNPVSKQKIARQYFLPDSSYNYNQNSNNLSSV